MEDALVGIFDKDVPPSVTAVAASVTQSSTTSPVQAIIHCPLPALSSLIVVLAIVLSFGFLVTVINPSVAV
jgi:hypothetical protein